MATRQLYPQQQHQSSQHAKELKHRQYLRDLVKEVSTSRRAVVEKSNDDLVEHAMNTLRTRKNSKVYSTSMLVDKFPEEKTNQKSKTTTVVSQNNPTNTPGKPSDDDPRLKRQIFRDRLFSVSRQHVDEVPADRKQSGVAVGPIELTSTFNNSATTASVSTSGERGAETCNNANDAKQHWLNSPMQFIMKMAECSQTFGCKSFTPFTKVAYGEGTMPSTMTTTMDEDDYTQAQSIDDTYQDGDTYQDVAANRTFDTSATGYDTSYSHETDDDRNFLETYDDCNAGEGDASWKMPSPFCKAKDVALALLQRTKSSESVDYSYDPRLDDATTISTRDSFQFKNRGSF
jgi:hypothetical protein